MELTFPKCFRSVRSVTTDHFALLKELRHLSNRCHYKHLAPTEPARRVRTSTLNRLAARPAAVALLFTIYDPLFTNFK